MTLEKTDGRGNIIRTKTTVVGDEHVDHVILEGAVANLNLDLDTSTPLPVDVTGSGLTHLAALAGAILSGSMKAVLQAGTALIGKVDVNTYAPYIEAVPSADLAPHQLSSQVVKAPVFLRGGPDMTGSVTISDGTHPGVVLKKGDALPVHVTNLNQITYTFSVNAGTEKLQVSTGV